MGNHRAQRGPRRSSTSAPTAPVAPVVGKRRAATPQRRAVAIGLPSAPLIAGVTALAISAGGAVTAAGADDLVGTVPSGSAISAAGLRTAAGGQALSQRASIVSRDSRRDAEAAESEAELIELAERRVAQQQAVIEQMRKAAAQRAATIKENKWVLPMASYSLTATFGQYGLWASYHTGLDFNGNTGDSIYAVANGTITSVGYDGAYGNKTVLTLDDGTEIWYAHQNTTSVSVGERVNGGDFIGTVGATGNVTGSHLHLEVRPGGGGPINPFDAFVDHGIVP